MGCRFGEFRVRAQILGCSTDYHWRQEGDTWLPRVDGGVYCMDTDRNTDEFVRLLSLHTRSIFAYIYVLVPNPTDADDIFQETSRTLWEKFGEYRPGPDENFRAWALRIAQIKVMRYRERESYRNKLFNDQAYAALDGAALKAVDSLDPRFELLGDCYRKLLDDDRRLITARYRIGASVEAIAQELGRSVHSIYRALRRIHESLFDCVRRGQQEDHS
jgi:RNA polymerase sigma-70 factor, ECF subfamily